MMRIRTRDKIKDAVITFLLNVLIVILAKNHMSIGEVVLFSIGFCIAVMNMLLLADFTIENKKK